MQKIGIDPVAQTERAKKLIDTFGLEQGSLIAWNEQQEHEENYKMEFILDEPVSKAHTYHTFGNEFYSYPLKHDLLKISKSIHPGERDGRTLAGFAAYEKTANDPKTEAAVWYSPAGKAGNKAPFDKIFFDSGRLYLTLKLDPTLSLHLDVKIDERSFPIKDLLDFLADRPRKEGENQFYYLDHPIGFAKAKELIEKLSDFQLIAWCNPIAYVSRRNDPDRKVFTWNDMVNQINDRIETAELRRLGSQQQTSRAPDALSIATLLQPETLENRYYQMIYDHMEETGREELFLYGCSATNTVKRSVFQTSYGLERDTPSTNYSTNYRMESINHDDSDSQLKCVECPFCHSVVDADIADGKIICPACNSSAPYSS